MLLRSLPQIRAEFLHHPEQAVPKLRRVQLQLRGGFENGNVLDYLGKLAEQLVKNTIDLSQM